MWWEMMVVPMNGGEQYVKKACGFTLLPTLLVENGKVCETATVTMTEVRENSRILTDVLRAAMELRHEQPRALEVDDADL